MSKATKIWLIVAASLVVLGIIIFGVIMSIMKWDFLKFGTVKYETNTHEISEGFSNVSIKTATAAITFLPSENGKIKVVCYEESKMKHDVNVENDTLVINKTNNKKWYDHIGINVGSPKITVYLPEGEYGSLIVKDSTGDVEISEKFKFESIDITVSTGDIKLSDISAGAIDLSTSTGHIIASDIICEGDLNIKVTTGKTKLSNVECNSLTSTGSTGDLSLTSVIVSERIDIKRDTGDVTFDGCDAGELHIVTDTGDVKGTLLSEKVFIAQTDTGRRDLPKTTSGGVCEITTDTGNIIIKIK